MAKTNDDKSSKTRGGLHVDTPKVYVRGWDAAIQDMFTLYGFRVVYTQNEADIVVFKGGPDIHPMLYGETRRRETVCDFAHDMEDLKALARVKQNQSLIGICRGAQLLNVMIGRGSLIQHVTGHIGYHDAYEYEVSNPRTLSVSSTHHQLMVPGDGGTVLLAAKEGLEYFGESYTNQIKTFTTDTRKQSTFIDPEAVLYFGPNPTLCFQPHPELKDKANEKCRDMFFEYVMDYLLTKQQSTAMVYNNNSERKKAS